MMRALGVLALLFLLGGCAAAGKAAVGVLAGGGPNVAANVQAGKTNVQSLGATRVVDQRLENPQARTIEQSAGETQVRTERVETVVVRNDAPPWIWGLVILGWVLPTPGQIFRAAWRMITKGRG